MQIKSIPSEYVLTCVYEANDAPQTRLPIHTSVCGVDNRNVVPRERCGFGLCQLKKKLASEVTVNRFRVKLTPTEGGGGLNKNRKNTLVKREEEIVLQLQMFRWKNK